MAAVPTWKCSSCNTVNRRRSGPCMVCGAPEATAAAKVTADIETPTTTVKVAPPPKAGPPPGSKPPPRAPLFGTTAPGTTPSSAFTPLGTPATSGKATAPTPAWPTAAPTPSPTRPHPVRPAATATVPSPSPAPAPAPRFPVTPTTASPGTVTARPVPPRRAPSRGSTHGMRKLAVGKLLGVGHIALWVYAIYAAAWHLAWGRSLLAGAHHLSPVSGTTAASLRENGIVHGRVSWLSHLPWADNGNTYFLLAVACLVIRLRRAPGWLSLAVALPAAVYGLLRAL